MGSLSQRRITAQNQEEPLFLVGEQADIDVGLQINRLSVRLLFAAVASRTGLHSRNDFTSHLASSQAQSQ